MPQLLADSGSKTRREPRDGTNKLPMLPSRPSETAACFARLPNKRNVTPTRPACFSKLLETRPENALNCDVPAMPGEDAEATVQPGLDGGAAWRKGLAEHTEVHLYQRDGARRHVTRPRTPTCSPHEPPSQPPNRSGGSTIYRFSNMQCQRRGAGAG